MTQHNPVALQPGDHRFTLDGPVGLLEGISHGIHGSNKVAIICHPHPLHEGTMHNKVVHMLGRAFNNQAISSIRFNYRGVGHSEGTFGESVGETEDLITVIDWLFKVQPQSQLILAGFSFGAYIAAAGASKRPCEQLFSVCPAVLNQPFDILTDIRCPWVVIQSTEDEVVPPESVYAWFERHQQKVSTPMILLKEIASHFFHGKLVPLRSLVEAEVQKRS